MPVMKFCPNNHYYDSERYPTCPYCKGNSNIDITTPADIKPQTQEQPKKQFNTDSNKTVSVWSFDTGTISPVVGWLVCVEGEERGQDFRIHVENNYVGRDSDCDICLKDPHISRNHFTITYDPVSDTYIISMSGGKAIVRINGKPLTGSETLKKGDKIAVGKTVLVFIPLSAADINWEWDKCDV